MSFIDSWHWAWLYVPFILKMVLFVLFLIGSFCTYLVFIGKMSEGFYVGILLIVGTMFFPPFFLSPSTEDLVSLYENGKINKKDFNKFLPYAIMTDEKKAKDREESKAKKNKEKEALKTLKEKKAERKKEAEEFIIKFKEREREYELY